MTYTIEQLTAIGGKEWQAGDKHRVYFNNWAALAGLVATHYKSGNISSATYQGETISNSDAYKIVTCMDKVWFDTADGKIHGAYGYSHPRIGRAQVWADVIAGIKAAVAALPTADTTETEPTP